MSLNILGMQQQVMPYFSFEDLLLIICLSQIVDLQIFVLVNLAALLIFIIGQAGFFFPCFAPKLAKNNNLVLWFSSSYLSSLFGSFSFVLFIYLFFMVFSTVF